MITIRTLQEDDIESLKKIHKQYEHEFDLEEFNSFGYLHLFVAEEDGQMLCAGGIRLIPEIVIVTDKSRSVKARRHALLDLLQCFGHLMKKSGYNTLHAFVQDNDWMKHLMKYGFRHTKGTSLFFNLSED